MPVQEKLKVNKERNSDSNTLHHNSMTNGKSSDNKKRYRRFIIEKDPSKFLSDSTFTLPSKKIASINAFDSLVGDEDEEIEETQSAGERITDKDAPTHEAFNLKNNRQKNLK